MSKRYLIIGGGIAGTTAAEELRKRDATADITLVEGEEYSCYSRVLLPHYVKGVVPREKVFLRREEWYDAQCIEFLQGTRVTAIDHRNRFVRTETERELPFDALLLATGGEVQLAPSHMRGVSYLRTLDDADHLVGLLRELRAAPEAERAAVVVGGGFIALEYINIFAHERIATTVVMRGSGFWSRILSPQAQTVLAAQAARHEVVLLPNEGAITLAGDRALEHVVLASGAQLPARILGVGIGIGTDRSIIEGAGIACEHGILASARLETNLADVYTAGDVAEVDHSVFGRKLQIGNWLNAQMQGRAVAKAMYGEDVCYDLVTSYATQLLGMHVVFIGDTSRAHADEVQVSNVSDTSCADLFFREGRIVGATLVGDIAARGAITKAIQERRSSY